MSSPEEIKQQIDEEIELAGQLFRDLDVNNDDCVCRMELMNGLKQRRGSLEGSGKDIRCKFYADLFVNFEEADVNKDDKLSMKEFISYFDRLKTKYIDGFD